MRQWALRSWVTLAAFWVIASAMGASCRADGPVVVVNGLPVVKFKAFVDGVSPSERATRAALALLTAAGPQSVGFKPVPGKGHAIVIGSDVALIVTSVDVGDTARGILEVASKLKRALALPPLKVTEDSIRVPLGGVREIGIVGSRCEGALVNCMNPNVATVERTSLGFKINPLTAGHASIVVGYGTPEDLTISVIVQPYAATFPQTLTANVSGSPATASTIEGALVGALRTQLMRESGVTLEYKLPPVQSMGEGRASTYSVKVAAHGSKTIDNEGRVDIVVRNVPATIKRDAVLWYSNDPESVRRPGPLFSSELKLGDSARLLYHHMNATTRMMLLRVQVVNDSDVPVRLLLIPGDSRPDPNPVRAGMRAAIEFMQEYATNSGEVVTIPPRSTIPLSIHRFGPNDTVSGLCSIRMIEGESVLVRTDAWPPYDLDSRWSSAIRTSTPWREVGANPINQFDRAPYEPSVHVYPNPYKKLTVKYTVGGRFGMCRIGEAPIATADSHNNLDGNYGVIYTIQAALSNPTRTGTDVDLILESSSGYTTGVFMLEGRTVYAPYLGPKNEYRVARFHLPPGSNRQVEITTLPISGGSYPVTLTLRPAPHR